MRTVKLTDSKPGEVFARLAGIFGNVFRKSYKSGEDFFGVIVGEKYFLRRNSDVAIIVVVSGHGDSTTVDMTAAGGKEGLILHWDWWAHEDFMRSVQKALKGKIDHDHFFGQIPLVYGVDVKKLRKMIEEKRKKRKNQEQGKR